MTYQRTFDGPLAAKRCQLEHLALENSGQCSVRALYSAGIMLDLIGDNDCPLQLPLIRFVGSTEGFEFLWGYHSEGLWLGLSIYSAFASHKLHDGDPRNQIAALGRFLDSLPIVYHQDNITQYQNILIKTIEYHTEHLDEPDYTAGR